MPAGSEQLVLVLATPAQRLQVYRTSSVCFAGGASVDEYVEQQNLLDRTSEGIRARSIWSVKHPASR